MTQGSTLGTRLYTMMNGVLVGEDPAGNRYYEARKPSARDLYRRKRWVIFKGRVEASKVPADWHAWLHHTAEAPLKAVDRPWSKPHMPNLTGTPHATVPKGDERAGGRRQAATADYQAWRP